MLRIAGKRKGAVSGLLVEAPGTKPAARVVTRNEVCELDWLPSAGQLGGAILTQSAVSGKRLDRSFGDDAPPGGSTSRN
jgi:hypothetical protein